MNEKRTGWNGNEASRDERKEPNFLFDLDADFCDQHETAFKLGERCPKCVAAETAAK